MSRSGSAAIGNRLLASLPATVSRPLLAASEQVRLPLDTVLCRTGQRLQHVYFPIDSFISMLATSNGDVPLEVGLVGDEGMLGLNLVLGIDRAPLQGIVQGAGLCWRLEARHFERALAARPAFQRQLNRYLYVTLAQLAQTTVCTRFHVVEARLARWLLMTRDRAHADEFYITHEFLARMLGVRRVGITRAAGALRRQKLIRYSRGDLQIIDGRALERAACSCYAADRNTYERVMGP